MFLRCKVRKKNGKEHRSWSIVENRRVAGGRVVQRHVLYLGEINGSQQTGLAQIRRAVSRARTARDADRGGSVSSRRCGGGRGGG